MLLGVEEPERPCRLVRWSSVDAHEAFRTTPGFRHYRSTIADTFTSAPTYRHHVVAGPESATSADAVS